MGKPKWIWDALKILSGLAASATLQFSKASDKPISGYTPPGPPDSERMLPALMGVAQADWITASVWAGTGAAAVVALDGVWGLIRERRLRISEEKKKDIEKAVLEILPRAGIAKATTTTANSSRTSTAGLQRPSAVFRIGQADPGNDGQQ